MFQWFKTNFNHRKVYHISISIVYLAFSILQIPYVHFDLFWSQTSNAFTFDDGYVSFRTQTNNPYQWLCWEVSGSCLFVCQNRSIFDNSAFLSLAIWPPCFFEVSAILFFTSLDINDNITNKPAIDYSVNWQDFAFKNAFFLNFLLF